MSVESKLLETAACPHANFDVVANVARIGKTENPQEIVAYMVDLSVFCHDCRQPFEFFNVPYGLSFYQPTMSINGREIHLPIVIPGAKPPEGMAGFRVAGVSLGGAQ